MNCCDVSVLPYSCLLVESNPSPCLSAVVKSGIECVDVVVKTPCLFVELRSGYGCLNVLLGCDIDDACDSNKYVKYDRLAGRYEFFRYNCFKGQRV